MAIITKGSIFCFVKIFMFLSIEMGYLCEINAEIKEYCYNEDFNPKCDRNEVIVVNHALYGRMKLGKCVAKNRGDLGCQTNVLNILQRKCSNRQECFINLGQDLYANKDIVDPCDDRSRYLEADYICKLVLQIDSARCRSVQTPFNVETSLAISSQKMYDSDCGSATLIISARPGQILNIRITDFSWDKSHNPSRSCINYLELEDLNTNRKTHVCAGTAQFRQILNTTSHQIKAMFQLQDPENQQFLLHFEGLSESDVLAQGCADIVPPEGTWVQRHGQETTLGCHHGDHTWTLTCQNNQWRGAVGDCGTGFKVLPKAERKQEPIRQHIAPGMLIFATVSLLMFVSACSFTIAVCIYSHRGNPDKRSQSHLIIPPSEQVLVPASHGYPYNGTLAEGHRFGTTVKSSDLAKEPEAEYMNTHCSKTDSMHSDSVKYYVLENVTNK